MTETKDQRLTRFIMDLKKEPLVKKYLEKHSWLSGSSTEVHPVTIWEDTIVLQWTCRGAYFGKFIQRIIRKNPDILVVGWFVKHDGSCPAEIIFKRKKDKQ